jgi:hypothetical protein
MYFSIRSSLSRSFLTTGEFEVLADAVNFDGFLAVVFFFIHGVKSTRSATTLDKTLSSHIRECKGSTLPVLSTYLTIDTDMTGSHINPNSDGFYLYSTLLVQQLIFFMHEKPVYLANFKC